MKLLLFKRVRPSDAPIKDIAVGGGSDAVPNGATRKLTAGFHYN